VSKGGEEDGYALLAAVAAIAIFATLALGLVAKLQGSLLLVGAEIERARAEAAAEAGVAVAIANMIGDDRAFRWALDGRPRTMNFAGSRLTIRLIDQRGKVPLLALDEDQVRKLFELLDVPPEQIEVVTDSYLDWTDDDDEPRTNGAEFAYYARRRIRPPNGPPQSFEELALVRGFDAGLLERLRSVATLHFGNGGFDPRHADPVAIALLSEGGENAPELLARQRELAGQRVAIELDDANVAGRTVEVLVDAVTGAGGQSHQRRLVELTGSPSRPYAILEAD
jgi:general secretion pathway protein K